ncbi:MAG TPA: outer membrane beta-barrel protein [bacterium]|nr:outer membrane beta-barrel protein [bacterium]
MKTKWFLAAFFISLTSLTSALWAGADSGVEFQVEGGMVSPVSKQLYDNYTSGYSFGAAIGYKFSSHFSVLLDGEYQDVDGQNPFSSTPFALNTLEMAVLEKYRFDSISNIHPFLFIGEGAVINIPSGGNPLGADSNETDALAEGGLGVEFSLGDRANAFIQAKESLDLTKPSFSPDKVTLYLPIQVGVNFSL